MSFDDAVSALSDAVENEGPDEPSMFAQPAEPVAPAVVEQAAEESAPQGESATDPSAAPADPQVAPAETAAVDTFDDGKFNPDTLPAELRPAWNQLQAAFTRKTQDVAAQRQQFESLGITDLNQAAEAIQLHQQLQDPSNWPRFQQEIAQLMEQRGIAPTSPVTPAERALATTPAAPTPSQLDALAQQYPELAPLAETTRSLQAELQQVRASFDAQQHQLALERQALAVQGEFGRQESLLRESGVNEKDLQRIYEIAPAHNGNLLAANEAFQSMKNDVLSEYLASKAEVQNTPVAPIGGAAAASSMPAHAATLGEATDIALETLRAQGIDNFEF
jgi:hypothetical protein